MSELELRRSWETLREMLRDRGYEGVPEAESVSAEDFAAAMAGKYVFHIDLPSIRHRVVYELSSRFKSGNIKKLVDSPDLDVVIVVVREQPTSASLKGMDALGKDIQFFNMAELQFNVSKHSLVPPHAPVRAEQEIEAVVADHQVKSRYHFPIILSSDPMARYLGLKPGQLVRVTRASPSAGRHFLYRCCMKA
jgi:DNA-directed RNA polymerases I, II, and III subunit RPABC1